MDAMKSHIRTITTAVVAVSVLFGLLAQSAHASSLLSGYGGPGQGNQAILGAALLNGPGEGGGGTGSQGGQASGGGIAIGESPSAGAGEGSGGASHRGARGGSAGSSVRAHPRAPHVAQGSALRTASEASVSSPTLGISGAELLYILLGLGALALTAVLTRQLTRHR